jgi:hypothetical protein
MSALVLLSVGTTFCTDKQAKASANYSKEKLSVPE